MSEPKGLSSDKLLAQLFELGHRGRKLKADLIEHLAEVDARRLYLREGCSSMFTYCVGVLRFAEAVAYKRIAAMRAARRYPEPLMALLRIVFEHGGQYGSEWGDWVDLRGGASMAACAGRQCSGLL